MAEKLTDAELQEIRKIASESPSLEEALQEALKVSGYLNPESPQGKSNG